VRLPATLASGLDDEDDEDDDNKGRASAVPSWELVARSWSKKKANKKEQVSEEPEDMEEVVEFPNQEEEEEEEEDVVSEESDPDFVPPIADDNQGQKAATASAPHLIHTKKSRESPPLLICTPTGWTRQNLNFFIKRNHQCLPTLLGSVKQWTALLSLRS
jgi:hypothetical protein